MRFSFRSIRSLDVLVVTTALWFLAKLFRYAFPPLFEPLQSLYDISSSELGLAFSGLMVCYAAMQFPSGLLRDRIGPTRVIVVGGLVAGGGALSLAFGTGVPGLMIAMLVIGLGTGVHKTVAVVLLARVYPDRTGRVLGVHDTLGAGAGLVAPFAALYFFDLGRWWTFFAFAGILAIGFALAAALTIPPRVNGVVLEPTPRVANGGYQGYRRFLADRRLLLFLVVTIGFAFAYNGVVAFVPLYLADVAGLGVGMAGALYSVLFAMTVSQLVTGELSDRIGRLPIILACICFAMIGIGGLLVFTTTVALGVAIVVLGIGAHGYRPVRDAYLTAIIPDDIAGGGMGLVRSVLMGAGAVAPGIVGIVADGVGFRPAFGLLGGSFVIAAVAVIALMIRSPGR